MNYIFLINDQTEAATEATAFALELAVATESKLIVGTPRTRRMSNAFMLQGASAIDMMLDGPLNCPNLIPHAFSEDQALVYANVLHEEVDTTGMDSRQIAQLIARYPVSVIIKGNDGQPKRAGIDMQTLLNRVSAPIWLIPPAPAPALPGKLAYITDLRYCRTDLLTRVLNLTMSIGTNILVIHQTAPGLPDLGTVFAKALFYEMCRQWPCADRLFLHHIREPDIATAADVLINGMQIDGLILANQSTHFQQVIIEFLTPAGQAPATQLMLFPG